MEPLLFLSQRIPYPPEKGEKIRAWRILQHFAGRFEVHLGCLHDDPDDARHIAFLQGVCADVFCPPLVPWRAKLRSLARVARGEPLTLGYFENGALRRWVEATLRARRPSRIFVFSSAMASYVRDCRGATRVLDMVDVDSDKWRQYAATRPWPLSAIYRREHRTLLAFERSVAREFDATLLVSQAETALFRSLAPEAASRVHTMTNGIDGGFFDPERAYDNPYPRRVPIVVFTGAMDYWPNVQAVTWFASDIMPALRQRRADLEFFIVGINPAPAVRRLASLPGVTVTGRVADVRPYLSHANVVVAPLRIARGVQNKVLEAMAMAKPVIATPEACQGIAATPGRELLVAATAADFAARVAAVLGGEGATLGQRARERILRDYQWNFDMLDGIMAAGSEALAAAG
jgi:sugar transferase (PEP-CTERM/EpsH1 system associated)